MANVTTANTIAALQAATVASDAVVYLSALGREGEFTWRTGNFTSQSAADPLKGIYVPSSTTPVASGCWVRDWDGVNGRPDWFGATRNNSAFDNQPAIQSCINNCPTTHLLSGVYYTASRILITINGRRVLGAGLTQTDQGANSASTQIICTSATETILQIGSDSATQPNPLVETVQLEDFTVNRSVNPSTPASGYAGSIGIAMRWCVNCHVERVFSINSCRGWYFFGTIENYVFYCGALRDKEGSNAANDPFIGFHLDYTAPLAANGGNASLYILYCRAFGLTGNATPSLTYSAGLRTDGGWVDLYIHGFETGTLQYGIHGNGDAYNGGTSFRTEDLIVTNCVLDGHSLASIRLETADTSAAMVIADNYFAVAPSGTAIVLYQIGGSVTVANNQCITGGVGATGLSITNVNNLRSSGNILTKLKQPIFLDGVTGFHIADTIHGLDTGNTYAAVSLRNCVRGKIDTILNGPSGCVARGVEFVGTTNSLVEVAATNLQASAITGGAANKIVYNGTPVTATGAFGNNCLAQGIMA